MPKLTVIAGADSGQCFPVKGPVVRIGRHHDNEVVLADGLVSRLHAQIEIEADTLKIRDCGSRHGTLVNGEKIKDIVELQDGDTVQIGKTELAFSAGDTGPAVVGVEASDDQMPLHPDVDGGGGNETIAFSLPGATTTFTQGPDAGLTDEHLRRLTAAVEAVQSVLDLDPLLGKLMDVLCEMFRANRGMILLHDQTRNTLVPKVTRPVGQKIAVSRTVIRNAIDKRMALLVSDMDHDDRFDGAQSIITQSIRAAICAPLMRQGRVLGVIYLDAQGHALQYDKVDVVMLNLIAANAAISIENAMLVSEKVRAERLAAVGMAVAGISHYVKNILTGARGASQLIEVGLEREELETVRKAWPILNRADAKIADLVQDMLTYSREREPDWQDGNFNETLAEVCDNQSERATECGVELVREFDGDMPLASFDPKAMTDVFLNLVGNAVEACQEMVDVKVTVRSAYDEEADQVRIDIMDKGPGIPPDVRKRILEPFFTTKGSKGTGLGLAVSSKVVEEHGGQLLVDSEEGVGTTFSVLLPFRPASQETLG